VKREPTRTYRLRERARREQETRRRIVDATVELHETLGPSRTTIVDIAKRAGVSRPTVYAHFPDERALFDACSRHWYAAHPRPDPAGWSEIADPERRVGHALAELYAYFAENQAMLSNVFRDLPLYPAVREAAAARNAEWNAKALTALRGGRRSSKLLDAAIVHALDFRTWSALARDQGVPQRTAVELATRLVCAAAER
jgi:AcrR family transcriptional regulator